MNSPKLNEDALITSIIDYLLDNNEYENYIEYCDENGLEPDAYETPRNRCHIYAQIQLLNKFRKQRGAK